MMNAEFTRGERRLATAAGFVGVTPVRD